jgi:hypothetical protein
MLTRLGLLQRSTELLNEIGTEFKRALAGIAYISVIARCPERLGELYGVGLLLESDEDKVLGPLLVEVTFESKVAGRPLRGDQLLESFVPPAPNASRPSDHEMGMGMPFKEFVP